MRNETPLLAAFWLLTLAAFGALIAVNPDVGRGTVTARAGDSMIRPENFARALAEVPREGTISMLRLEPESARLFIDGAPDGTGVVIVEAGGDVDSFGGGSGRPATGGIKPEAVDRRMPMRLLATLRRRRGDERFDYMSLMWFAGRQQWSVFIDGTQAVVAGARRRQRRAGAEDIRRRQRGFQGCVQRAIRRGADAGACATILTGSGR